MIQIGFTGTREGMTPEQKRTLVELLAGHIETVWLHHGCCVGADEQAHWLAFELGIGSVGHPPTDTKFMMKIDGKYPELQFIKLAEPKPYLERNRNIVDATDRLIACPKEIYNPFIRRPWEAYRRGGTWHTVRYAVGQGKPVAIIYPSGEVTRYD